MSKKHAILIGDSHTIAIKAALKREKKKFPEDFEITILRLHAEKKGEVIGDIYWVDFISDPSYIQRADVVLLALRGNQYNTIGLIQHPMPFDFFLDQENDGITTSDQLVPSALIREFFEESLRSGYGKHIKEVAAISRVPVYCLFPPAPKEDSEHIKANAEGFFRDRNIENIGVTKSRVRLKLWTLQNAALQQFCHEIGVRCLPNPEGTRDGAGFLRREYYAPDATHGNAAYGSLVLRQITNLLDACPTLKTEAER